MTRLEIGRITKAHGLNGEVVVALTTNRTERLDPGAVLHAGDRELVVESSRPQRDKWLVNFAGLASREDADELHGAILTAEALDDPDELWVHELIGSLVVDAGGTERGTVESVLANPAADVLVLDSGALVPLTFVVDHGPGRIVIDPPEGLFDL